MGARDSGQGRPYRILVIDDDPHLNEVMVESLRLFGEYEVISAADGAAGLELCLADPPDIAVIDVRMPKLDGYEVARRIRAQPWGRRITLVALTGWGQESDRRRSGEAGFDSHLVKPLDLDKLTELLGRLPVPADVATVGTSVA